MKNAEVAAVIRDFRGHARRWRKYEVRRSPKNRVIYRQSEIWEQAAKDLARKLAQVRSR